MLAVALSDFMSGQRDTDAVGLAEIARLLGLGSTPVLRIMRQMVRDDLAANAPAGQAQGLGYAWTLPLLDTAGALPLL